MRLDNKVALISGGARGMGATEARMFAQEGAKVVIGDVLEEEGRQTEAAINESGGECLFVALDVTDESNWEQAVAAAVNRFGKLDILVNNAGIARISNVENTSADEWDLVMDINAKGVFLGTKAAIPAMREAGGGSIVNISSIAGLVGREDFGLLGQQGRGASAHQVNSHPVRRRGHPLQLGASRRNRVAHDPAHHAEHRGRTRGVGGPPPDWAHRPAGGHRLWRPVPGVGRGLLYDRERAGHRRRTDGAVACDSRSPKE